jgi:hypothetical protein
MDHPCRLVVEDFVETKCSPELFLRVCSEDRTALERVGYVVWRFFFRTVASQKLLRRY